jgi:hypothetical protein
MKNSTLCPASLLMIIGVLLSCFAFLFSKSETQVFAAAIICGVCFSFFLLIQWCNNAANKF